MALTPLVAIAAYAVMLRVNQYGWTPERVIAAACVVVAACYALGYGLAAFASRSSLRGIEMTNMVTAVIVLAMILVLFSPVADPARVAVADQVARLEAGQTPVDKFDFLFLLRFHGGRYGMAALDRLRQKPDGPEAAWEVVVARTLQPDCLTAHHTCDAVMLDRDGGGTPEIMMSAASGRQLVVFGKTDGKWKIDADFYIGSCDARAIIKSQQGPRRRPSSSC